MIHIYQLNGYNLVLDINSGAVHAVTDLAYAILEISGSDRLAPLEEIVVSLKSRFPEAEIRESYEELAELQREGLLYAEEDYIDLEKFQPSKAPIKAMCLHIAHDCNLRCNYCFAHTGDFSGARSMLDFETGKKALDFLIRESAQRKNLEVDFFGGEPLMNFEVVKQLVEYARSQEELHQKKFRFTITTNGVLLSDDVIDYINENMFNVVLSLDGRKEVNDLMRHRIDGSGSYDSIVPKYQKLVQKRGDGQYYVRGTFTRNNLDFTADVEHLFDLGFQHVSAEPVVAPDEADYSLREQDLPKLYAEYEKLAVKLLEEDDPKRDFFHFKIDLKQGPCVIKRMGGCGSGNEYVAVTPDGDIYPCHQFVGMEEYRMGSVHTGELNRELKERFSKLNVYSKPECRACWAKFYCSGGCNANNLQYGGDLMTPYKIGCALEKKRVECAIMIAAAKQLKED